ncbi:MAG: AAA family ATPase [Cyanobacteriota bacterium]|nr:AAA family ATPase [Cyanobacteriota bacterium]
MTSDTALLKALFNSFKPDMPLEPGDPRYVDCKSVRGDEDIITELGGYITKDENNTYQLYSGHRGGGKSTELLRLAKYLEESEFLTVYFAAATDDAGDLSFQDTQYQDILLSCTRQLLGKLKNRADTSPIENWLRDRWEELTDLALTEVKLEKLNLDVAVSQFAKITAAVRTEPNKRRQIRELVEPNTESLVQALNQFIHNAKAKVMGGENRLVVIADNLDRIVQNPKGDGNFTNLEDIFINRSELMRSLDCHIIYTAPISLLYSASSSELQNIYGKIQILPMVMVQSPEGEVLEEGMDKLRTAIARRVLAVCDRELVPQVFDSEETLRLLCFSCGGQLRDLMHMAREAVNQMERLPIAQKAVKRAIAKFRRGYMEALLEAEWPLLLQVRDTKRRINEDAYRDLLRKRCILEYCFYNEDEERIEWYDVHPLIWGAKLFKERWEAYRRASDEG